MPFDEEGLCLIVNRLAGLLAYRELDETLGLIESSGWLLTDSPRGCVPEGEAE